MSCPSATFVVWTSAWLHGAAASDDVLDAVEPWGELHEVVAPDDSGLDLPSPGEPAAGLALLLAALRRAGIQHGELALPVPGDPRGVGSGEFGRHALRAHEAAVFAGSGAGGLGVIPEVVADGVVRWTAYSLAEVPVMAPVGIGEADFGLSEAMRDAAGALTELDVASHRPGVRAEIAERVDAGTRLRWPSAMPGRSLRVLQRAGELAAILDVASQDEPGGALSASAAGRRAEALRPLYDAVRTARCAAVSQAVAVLTDHAGRR